jgi:RecJ-like exonuclease
MSKCLRYYDVPFVVEFSRPKKPEEIAELSKEEYELFIFLDQGTAQLETIHKTLLAKHRDVLIVDHHPGDVYEHPNLAILNPHAIGLNGAKDVSASSASYALVENLDTHFRSLLVAALVGAIGDRQEFFSGFTGVNDVLYKRAADLGLVETREGLRLVGRSFRPLVETLKLSVRPYIPGVSGSLTGSREVLDEMELKHSILLDQISADEESALRDSLATRAGQAARSQEFFHTLWGPIHKPSSELGMVPLSLREYAALLDACGSLDKPEVGMAVFMGDKLAFQEALTILTSYQEEMLRVIVRLLEKSSSAREYQNFRALEGDDRVRVSLLGEALSLLIESGLVPVDRPVIVYAPTASGEVRVSARSTPALAMAGVNLGSALKACAQAVGGVGGGHDVAAAARIPPQKVGEFLAILDEHLGGRHEVHAAG